MKPVLPSVASGALRANRSLTPPTGLGRSARVSGGRENPEIL